MMKDENKTAKKEESSSISNFVGIIEKNLEYLNTVKVMSPGMAFGLLTKAVEGKKLVDSLIGLQEIYGMIITLHPESIYSPEFKQDSELYDKISDLSEKTSGLIDETLRMWQRLRSLVKPYTKTPRFCYDITTTQVQGSDFSFHLLILTIISNCSKLKSYLVNLSESEAIKVAIGNIRRDKMGEQIRKDMPQPPQKMSETG